MFWGSLTLRCVLEGSGGRRGKCYTILEGFILQPVYVFCYFPHTVCFWTKHFVLVQRVKLQQNIMMVCLFVVYEQEHLHYKEYKEHHMGCKFASRCF